MLAYFEHSRDRRNREVIEQHARYFDSSRGREKERNHIVVSIRPLTFQEKEHMAAQTRCFQYPRDQRDRNHTVSSVAFFIIPAVEEAGENA